MRSLVRWFIRQGQTTRMHYFGVWLLVKAPSAGRKDVPLLFWLLVPLFGHFVVALSFWLAIDPKMRWGKMTLEFNRDGTIREIRNRHG
jgi:hypothetical protein